MRFLFVHQHFPGQFSHVSAAIARQGHQVVAIGENLHLKQRSSPHPNIQRFGYDMPTLPAQKIHPYLRDYESHVRRGQAVVRVCMGLVKQGFHPDVVVAHPGWGEALFLKDILPQARHIHLCEFFYSAEGADVGFDPEFPLSMNDRLRVRTKNSTQLIGLNYADAGISPTAWQAKQFPESFRPLISVIHEGIDTATVAPDPTAWVRIGEMTLTPKDEVVTYVARNLEPHRGFHILAKILPGLLAERPQAHVLIVGGDGVSYGARAPGGATWRAHCLDPIRDQLDMSRVHVLGRLPYATYLNILRVSTAHVYLSYPFVLSWSMLEAMAAECLVVGSATAPVQECLTHEKNGLLCNFFDVDAWIKTISHALEHREELKALRRAARQTILERYDLKNVCLPRYLKMLGAPLAD